MARRRGVSDPHRLTRGPGCVAQALGLTLDHDGADLTRSPLWVADLPVERFGRRIVRGPRIGISRAADWEWRLFLDGHPCVSDPGVARRAGSGGKAPRRGSAVAGRARHPADRGIAPSSR
jgi:DNA-3-methyladenine glycosylase